MSRKKIGQQKESLPKHKFPLSVLLMVIFVLIIVGVALTIGIIKIKSKMKLSGLISAPTLTKIDAKEAYSLAIGVAKNWQADANLVSLETKEIGDDGKALEWQAEFHSKSLEKEGINYLITIRDNKITKAEAISSNLAGDEFKESWLRSEQVVEQIKATSADVIIESLNLYYDPDFKMWFWSAKTNRGVVTAEVK